MATKRIMLVNSSRLMSDMLNKVIGKTPDLEIVSNIADLTEFPEAVRRTKADWAIVLLPPDEQVPDVVEEVIKEQQSMRFLLMGLDGSHARMKWNEAHEVILDEKNLKHIIGLLRQDQNERIRT
jgi:chemotaxis response regulator CheB